MARRVLLFARVYRWFLLSCLVACSDATPGTEPAKREVAQFPAVESARVDILMLVDNSASTAHWQERFAAAMPAFLAALADADVRIGIITPDMGTTGSNAPDSPAPPIGTVGNLGCAEDGDGGVLRASFDRDTLTLPALSAALRVGSDGCGVEQHLHAIRRARESNTGFWRDDASTAIIALADEDDCSALVPQLFDASPALGPLCSFRCTTQGIVCDEPLDSPGPKTHCRAATTSPYIEDPALTKAALEAATPPPRTTFSVIAGTPEPIALEERAIGGQLQLALAHSCSVPAKTGGQPADPAVRMAELAASFGSRGGFHTVCAPTYDATVEQIARTIGRARGIACLDDDAVELDLASCVAHDVAGAARAELARCPASSDCFDIVPDTARCKGGLRVIVDRKATPAASTHVEVACSRLAP